MSQSGEPWQAHAGRRLDRLEAQTRWLAVAVVIEALALILLAVF